MAGNLIKGGYTVVNTNKSYVIDSNEAVKRKLEELRSSMEQQAENNEVEDENFADGFVEGLDPLFVERLVSDDENVISNGIDENEANATQSPLEEENMSSSITNEEAAAILDAARNEAEAIKANAEASGYEEGYQKGIKDGEAASADIINKKIAENEAICNQRIAEANERSKAYMESLEPLLVDKLCDIYSKVIGVEFASNKELILSLINSAMSDVDTNKEYTIHVSRQDAEQVNAKLSEVLDGTGILIDNVTVIEDNSVPESGCLIESELGIFDCGLGTQLELLKKQLKLISIE